MFRFDTTLRCLLESKLLLGNSDPDSELGRILGLPLYSLKFAPWRRSSDGLVRDVFPFSYTSVNVVMAVFGQCSSRN